jgi:hypothetical protein
MGILQRVLHAPQACGGGSVEAKNEKDALERALKKIERPAQSPRPRRLCAEKTPPPAGSSWQGRRGDRAASAEGQCGSPSPRGHEAPGWTVVPTRIGK